MSQKEIQQLLDTEEVDNEVLSDSSNKLDSEDADEQWIQWQREEHKAFHWVKIGCIYGLPILAAVVIVVYFLNLLLPCSCRWLTTGELSEIQSLVVSILSGVATSLAVNYFYRNK